ncbi:LysR family transcriptional regulator [Peristeroidobacter agariperforans]|uniref:LysR family transcriptional regulator n=1 Tax=Peristeroidobacter agariperforans TaxID=268404 RepID=UPI00101D9B62|nr:LysR family transcriptional regulator [Peristeroidobacter agariperforans]
MSRIEDFEAFIAIVENGSLTAAAASLRRSLQSVSRSLAALEQDVGIELLQRTTRGSSASEAGLEFYERVKPAIVSVNEAKLAATRGIAEPAGKLRISAPVLFGPSYLVPIIAEFMLQYPQVRVDLELSDAFVDLAAEQLDLAVRIGDLPDSSLRARRLGSLRRVVFAAPSYLDRHGVPEHPSDLSRHSCLVRTVDSRPGLWRFHVDDKPHSVIVHGAFRSNAMSAIYAAVMNGLGLGYSPLWQIKDLVDTGKVRLVLEAFEPTAVPIHVLWQDSASMPAKVRAFVDFLVSRLRLGGL